MKIIIDYSLLILWTIVMIILMGAPSDSLPLKPLFFGFDKLAHCGTFYVFTVLYFHGYIVHTKRRGSKIRSIIYAFFLGSLMAFGTEAIQLYYSSGRVADWWDIFADYMGIGMAILSYMLFYYKRTTYK